jgi:L-alanine-DL-glutamate epimerase-like enolase superfamily enzyme
MRITAVEIRLLEIDASPWYFGHPIPVERAATWHYPLVRVTTDEGIDGYSMGYGVNGEGRPNAYTIKDAYSSALIGKDPLHREAIWQAIRRRNRHLYAHTDTVLGILDVALWDIAGKVADLSIAAMLGLCRTSMPAYRVGSYFLDTPEMVFEEAQRYKADGFHGCKLNFFDGPRRDIPRLRAAREAVGEDFHLMHDASSFYSYTDALTVGHELGALNYHWFEEPVYDRQVGVLQRLSQELRVPILASETTTLAEKGEYLRVGAVDIMRGDVMNTGGISGLRKALAACELFGYNMEIHTASSPLLDVANLHVACSVTNCELFEMHHQMFRFGLKGAPLAADAAGFVHLPAGAGLGVELDWDWLDDHTVEALGSSAM